MRNFSTLAPIYMLAAIVAVGLILRGDALFAQLRANLYNVETTKIAASESFPWRSHEWWVTVCQPERSFSNQAQLSFPSAGTATPRMLAIRALSMGDCPAAIEQLQMATTDANEVSYVTSERLVLAYTHSMEADWSNAATIFPIDELPLGPFIRKQFWSSVYARAAESVVLEDAGLAREWRLKSDDLPRFLTMPGSTNLAHYLITNGREHEGFTELTRSPSREIMLAASVNEDVFQLAPRDGHGATEPAWQMTATESANDTLLASGYHVEKIEYLGELDALQDWVILPIRLHLRHSDQLTDQLIVQDVYLQNLLPAGRFEAEMRINGVRPIGFFEFYGDEPPYEGLSTVESEDGNAFCVSSSSADSRTGIRSDYFQLEDYAGMSQFLIGGHIKAAPGASAFMGIVWRDLATGESVTNGQLTQSDSNGDFVGHYSIVSIPDNMSEFALFAAQADSTGLVCFDNIFILPLSQNLDVLE